MTPLEAVGTILAVVLLVVFLKAMVRFKAWADKKWGEPDDQDPGL
jgi:hypothetical protein